MRALYFFPLLLALAACGKDEAKPVAATTLSPQYAVPAGAEVTDYKCRADETYTLKSNGLSGQWSDTEEGVEYFWMSANQDVHYALEERNDGKAKKYTVTRGERIDGTYSRRFTSAEYWYLKDTGWTKSTAEIERVVERATGRVVSNRVDGVDRPYYFTFTRSQSGNTTTQVSTHTKPSERSDDLVNVTSYTVSCTFTKR